MIAKRMPKRKMKIVRGFSLIRRKKRITKLKNFCFFLIPILIISVFAYGIVIPVYKYKDEASVKASLQSEHDVEMSHAQKKKALTIVNDEKKMSDSYDYDLVSFKGVKIDSMLVDDLRQMLNDAERDGKKLKLKKGYVSLEDQKNKYDSELRRVMDENNCTESKAKSVLNGKISIPGCDEYQTGLVVSIGQEGEDEIFEGTEEFEWLNSNCVNYGFILRFPEEKTKNTKRVFDPSCYRYVGIKNAKRMRMMGMSLEEYVSYLSER